MYGRREGEAIISSSSGVSLPAVALVNVSERSVEVRKSFHHFEVRDPDREQRQFIFNSLSQNNFQCHGALAVNSKFVRGLTSYQSAVFSACGCASVTDKSFFPGSTARLSDHNSGWIPAASDFSSRRNSRRLLDRIYNSPFQILRRSQNLYYSPT
jgi:hypothetical protein